MMQHVSGSSRTSELDYFCINQVCFLRHPRCARGLSTGHRLFLSAPLRICHFWIISEFSGILWTSPPEPVLLKDHLGPHVNREIIKPSKCSILSSEIIFFGTVSLLQCNERIYYLFIFSFSFFCLLYLLSFFFSPRLLEQKGWSKKQNLFQVCDFIKI